MKSLGSSTFLFVFTYFRIRFILTTLFAVLFSLFSLILLFKLELFPSKNILFIIFASFIPDNN